MRKLVITVIVLLTLLVAADFGARAYAESRTADAISSEVGTDVTPDVSIEGFPFLWHAVQGNYPRVVISASTTSADAIPGVRAVAELGAVTFPLRDARRKRLHPHRTIGERARVDPAGFPRRRPGPA